MFRNLEEKVKTDLKNEIEELRQDGNPFKNILKIIISNKNIIKVTIYNHLPYNKQAVGPGVARGIKKFENKFDF